MRALTRKLLRDLVWMRSQAVAIALVLAAGVAMFVAYFSTFGSLQWTLDSYYAQSRFADVFAAVKRAPLSLVPELAAIDGVAQVEVRVVVDVALDVPGMTEPAAGRLVALTLPRDRPLNDVYLRRGRDPEPGRSDEVLVSEAFATAHGLVPGDRVGAVINGRRRDLVIVGIALSPEYIYSIRAGDLLPDPARFGIFWMERRSLAAAFDMEGGFNEVSAALAPTASEESVAAALDQRLAPYGALGTIPRRLQLSNWFLANELMQLRTAGVLVPTIFLLVASFLLHVALTRLVAVQREQIAALKAMGYSNRSLALHYMQWSLCISVAGALIGIAAGAWLGWGMTGLYHDFFRFPALRYRLEPGYAVMALAIGATVGALGAIDAVRRVVGLAPAEAMRPAAPERFRQTWIERIGVRRRVGPAARMILRNTARQPVRTAMSVIGVAMAVAILIVGLFFLDAIDILLRIQFEMVQRQDVTVMFTEPVSSRAIFELERLPGVLAVEPLRAVPVEIRRGHRSRRTAITGLPREPRLNRVVNDRLEPVALALDGLVMSKALAEALDVRPGDVVELAVLEGERPVRPMVVSAIINEYMGASVYMERGALSRLVREAGSLSGAFLRVDRSREAALHAELKATPRVAGVTLKRAAIESFKKSIAQSMSILVFFNVLFACIISFGVVYNAARIVLSERSRDLASLRVLGFTRAEVSAILLGELAVIVALAIPVGLVLGQGLGAGIIKLSESELYRFPLIVTPRTRAFAVATVLVAAALSSLAVRRRVDRLDLVAVLKTRE
jgi:putative ABC transport system permease protein